MHRAAALLLAVLAPAGWAQDTPVLWYRQPAKLWVQALPVGNGRLGAMVFGGIAHERIQFNESTVWNGEPRDYSHRGAYKSLPQIRELLWAGKQKEAEELAMREFMSVPLRQKAYQAFGDLELDFTGIPESGVTGYRRGLNLDSGVTTVEFVHQGVTHRREVFANHPSNVVVVRLSASRPASLKFSARLKNAHEGTPGETIDGRVKDGAIRFDARFVEIPDSAGVTLLLSGATNFKNYQDVSADPKARN